MQKSFGDLRQYKEKKRRDRQTESHVPGVKKV